MQAGAAFVYCRETAETGHHFHARMFAPNLGLMEDPATGSAAAAFAGVCACVRTDTEAAIRVAAPTSRAAGAMPRDFM